MGKGAHGRVEKCQWLGMNRSTRNGYSKLDRAGTRVASLSSAPGVIESSRISSKDVPNIIDDLDSITMLVLFRRMAYSVSFTSAGSKTLHVRP